MAARVDSLWPAGALRRRRGGKRPRRGTPPQDIRLDARGVACMDDVGLDPCGPRVLLRSAGDARRPSPRRRRSRPDHAARGAGLLPGTVDKRRQVSTTLRIRQTKDLQRCNACRRMVARIPEGGGLDSWLSPLLSLAGEADPPQPQRRDGTRPPPSPASAIALGPAAGPHFRASSGPSTLGGLGKSQCLVLVAAVLGEHPGQVVGGGGEARAEGQHLLVMLARLRDIAPRLADDDRIRRSLVRAAPLLQGSSPGRR